MFNKQHIWTYLWDSEPGAFGSLDGLSWYWTEIKSPSAPPVDRGDPWKLDTELLPDDMPAKGTSN